MKLIKPNAQPTTLAGFSRASTATYIDDAGVLQTAGVDVPRFQGGQLLVEGAATNLVANNTMIGASSGSPGVLPTGWSSAASAGITRAVVGVGVEFGVQYIDIRFSGTNTSGSVGLISVLFGNSSGAVPATLGSIWTPSVYLKIAGGSLASLSSAAIAFYEKTAANAFVRTASGTLHTVTSSLQRFASPATVQGATTAFVDSPQVYFSMGVGASVDITLRVGFPQFEAGAATTSVIPTTTAAVTRAADIITGSGLLSTTATDATPAYSAGTTYLAGVQVHYNRVRYESLQSGNTGRTPDVNPTWWGRLGPVNQWAMFDDQVSTQTVQAAGPLRVALQTGAMDSLAVLGVDADRVRLVVQDGAGGPVVYDQEQGMAAEAVTNWFDYFFNDPMYRRTQALFSSIPPFGSSVATLTFASGSPVRVGHVSYGRVRSLGGLRYGARAGIKDFSRKDTDDFGNTTFVRRANSKYLTGTLEVEKFEINQVHNLLTSLTATPVVWIGSDDAYYSDTLLVFGFFRDFYCSIDYPTLAIYSIEIEGLI